MPALWWTITILLMLTGLVGTVVPLLPGTTIILAAAVLHHFMLGEAHSVGWWTIGGLLVLTILSYVLDLISGSLGAKKTVPASAGTFRTDGPTFVVLLVGVILLTAGLMVFPALTLGPIVEGLSH